MFVFGYSQAHFGATVIGQIFEHFSRSARIFSHSPANCFTTILSQPHQDWSWGVGISGHYSPDLQNLSIIAGIGL
jgi:hypothetical protein